jgi:hypothetical protein
LGSSLLPLVFTFWLAFAFSFAFTFWLAFAFSFAFLFLNALLNLNYLSADLLD